MRIVLKIDDDSALGRHIIQRMHATGLEKATVARMLLFQALPSSEVVEVASPLLPELLGQTEAIAAVDNISDDDPLLSNLLMEM